MAAVRDEVEQHAAGFRHVSRLDDGERRHVFHHPARVARRKFEIGDDGVQRELGVEFAIGMASEFLVSIVSERLRVFDHEPRDSCLSGNCQYENCRSCERDLNEWNLHA